MTKLSTIQEQGNLNEVFALNEKGPGGAYHAYAVIAKTEDGEGMNLAAIRFQKGARKDQNAVHGVLDVDLLEIVRHRLQCFQEGDFATEDTAEALQHIEAALHAMNRRVQKRLERGVLGTYEK